MKILTDSYREAFSAYGTCRVTSAKQSRPASAATYGALKQTTFTMSPQKINHRSVRLDQSFELQ